MSERIGLDIDGVLANFVQGIIDRGVLMGVSEHLPNHWTNWTQHIMPGDEAEAAFKKVWDAVTPDRSFWLGLQPMLRPEDIPFVPVAYCTARPISSHVTAAWLDAHDFPDARVITVPYGASKVASLHDAGVTIFVDDNVENFKQINGAPTDTLCLLWDAPPNRRFNAGAERIFTMAEVLRP